MYIKLIDGVPTRYSIGQLRQDNPQVSFPQTMPDSVLAEYSVYSVTPTEPPSHTETEVVENAGY